MFQEVQHTSTFIIIYFSAEVRLNIENSLVQKRKKNLSFENTAQAPSLIGNNICIYEYLFTEIFF